MKKTNLNIALKLEGPADEAGNIRLDDWMDEINSLRALLAAVDRDINGKQTVYFRVVDLSHSSPARIVIEPIVRPGLTGKNVKALYRNSPRKVHHAFFDVLTKIGEKRHFKIDSSVEVIDAVADMLDGLGKSFHSGWIENSQKTIQLNSEFKENLNELIRPQYQSTGSVSGELLSISLAHGRRFYIYPSAGPTSVACAFSADQLEKARENIGKTVRVYGVKSFLSTTGLPYRIAVERIEPLSPPTTKRQFARTMGVKADVPADELIREIREAWE